MKTNDEFAECYKVLKPTIDALAKKYTSNLEDREDWSQNVMLRVAASTETDTKKLELEVKREFDRSYQENRRAKIRLPTISYGTDPTAMQEEMIRKATGKTPARSGSDDPKKEKKYRW